MLLILGITLKAILECPEILPAPSVLVHFQLGSFHQVLLAPGYHLFSLACETDPPVHFLLTKENVTIHLLLKVVFSQVSGEADTHCSQVTHEAI